MFGKFDPSEFDEDELKAAGLDIESLGKMDPFQLMQRLGAFMEAKEARARCASVVVSHLGFTFARVVATVHLAHPETLDWKSEWLHEAADRVTAQTLNGAWRSDPHHADTVVHALHPYIDQVIEAADTFQEGECGCETDEERAHCMTDALKTRGVFMLGHLHPMARERVTVPTPLGQMDPEQPLRKAMDGVLARYIELDKLGHFNPEVHGVMPSGDDDDGDDCPDDRVAELDAARSPMWAQVYGDMPEVWTPQFKAWMVENGRSGITEEQAVKEFRGEFDDAVGKLVKENLTVDDLWS